MNNTRLTSTLLALLLTACQNTPQIQTGENAEVINGKLTRVDHANARLVYVDPDADINKYTAIMLMPLGVENVEIIQPTTSFRAPGSANWQLTDADKERLQNDFAQAMQQQLAQKGGYTLVTAPGDHVLVIAAILTRIAPNAPKDDNRSRPVGRSKIVTEGAGSMDVMVTFMDSETGEVLALAKDRRSGSSLWGLNTSITNAAEVRRAFNAWALQIRKQLNRIQTEKASP
jgi:hypothetical protein